MDSKLTEVSQLFDRFKAALVRNDFDTCTKLLSQLKVTTAKFTQKNSAFYLDSLFMALIMFKRTLFYITCMLFC